MRLGGAGFVSVSVSVSVRDRSMGGRSSRGGRARFGAEWRRSRSGRCAGRARGRSGRRDTRRCRRRRGWRGLDMRLRVKRRLCRGAPARSGLRACVDLGEKKISESRSLGNGDGADAPFLPRLPLLPPLLVPTRVCYQVSCSTGARTERTHESLRDLFPERDLADPVLERLASKHLTEQLTVGGNNEHERGQLPLPSRCQRISLVPSCTHPGSGITSSPPASPIALCLPCLSYTAREFESDRILQGLQSQQRSQVLALRRDRPR